MSKMICFLGVPFGIALAAACSSSTGSSTPSDLGSDSGGGSGSGSGSSSTSSGSSSSGGVCGPLVNVTCPSGQHCCTNTTDYSTMCGSTCKPGSIPVDCTSPSNCKDPKAPKCCGLGLAGKTGGDSGTGAAISGAVECVASCTSADIVFCDTDADCPTGQTCKAGQGGVKQCG